MAGRGKNKSKRVGPRTLEQPWFKSKRKKNSTKNKQAKKSKKKNRKK